MQGLPTVERLFGGGLVFKAHRLLYHSTLGLGAIQKKKKKKKSACFVVCFDFTRVHEMFIGHREHN